MPASPKYTRSEILNFFELPEAAQEEARSNDDTAEEDSFVEFFGDFLPLSNFIRPQHSKIWDGVYGTSYFSAYFIKIGKDGDQALVAERFS